MTALRAAPPPVRQAVSPAQIRRYCSARIFAS
nr:MAG TPA: hypothetical protein [Bacteriophage sp.]